MKIDEFMETVKQMENFYQKKMTDEQKRIWFESLKAMKIERFKYIVAHLYKYSKFMPKLADVFELNTSVGSIEDKSKTENKPDCDRCGNTGYVVYKQVITEDKNYIYDFGAICTCGRKKQYKG